MFTDTKALSEKGAWIHLKDQGRKAYALDEKGKEDKTKPIRVKVYGPHSETLQGRVTKRTAQGMKDRAKAEAIDDMSVEEVADKLHERRHIFADQVADTVCGWENMPGDVKFSHAKAVEIMRKYPAIAEQINRETGSIEDFLALEPAS